jgi:dihydropyrimidine dehydrogenase (NAD+) subunit PreT
MNEAADIRGGRLGPAEYEANFDDLYPPLDRREALVEASRCYFCFDAPCLEACPTGIDIPGFIRGIQSGNLKGAALKILDANIMGGTCARVCPTEILCEGACVRTAQEGKPVKIGLLQRHATDWLYEQDIQPYERQAPTGRRIAVVGAGPAGLACAHALARLGHDVVVFDRRVKAGGLNEHGVAAYKMARDFAQAEIAFITGLGGIEIRTGLALGRDVRLRDLHREFDAVFLGIGLAGVNALELAGEAASGVEDAVAFIERLRQAGDKSTLPVGRSVLVVGGGNTAIDIAMQTKRLGAESVTILYRRGPEHMSATFHEQETARLNGIAIRHWVRPLRIEAGDGRLRGLACVRTALDGAGRPVDEGEPFFLAADQLFKAIGQKLGRLPLDGTAPLLALEGGRIKVDEDFATSLPGVWAGGDCVAPGPDLTVVAVEHGKRAARAIHAALTAD